MNQRQARYYWNFSAKEFIITKDFIEISISECLFRDFKARIYEVDLAGSIVGYKGTFNLDSNFSYYYWS